MRRTPLPPRQTSRVVLWSCFKPVSQCVVVVSKWLLVECFVAAGFTRSSQHCMWHCGHSSLVAAALYRSADTDGPCGWPGSVNAVSGANLVHGLSCSARFGGQPCRSRVREIFDARAPVTWAVNWTSKRKPPLTFPNDYKHTYQVSLAIKLAITINLSLHGTVAFFLHVDVELCFSGWVWGLGVARGGGARQPQASSMGATAKGGVVQLFITFFPLPIFQSQFLWHWSFICHPTILSFSALTLSVGLCSRYKSSPKWPSVSPRVGRVVQFTVSLSAHFYFISPNSTWVVTSRFDTTRHVRRVERVVLFDNLDTAKIRGLDTSNVSCRVVTSQVECGLYWREGGRGEGEIVTLLSLLVCTVYYRVRQKVSTSDFWLFSFSTIAWNSKAKFYRHI